MNYKSLCEQIYLAWRSSPYQFIDFSKDFETNHLPEPYYSIKSGSNPLIILNNNPGSTLAFQEHSSVLNEIPDEFDYSHVSSWLKDKYVNSDIISRTARTRILRTEQIEEALGCDGVENVETFFLHSSSFNKEKFIRNYSNNEIVKSYISLLSEYLDNRPVLIVSAVGTKRSLNLMEVSNNKWIKYQSAVAGLDLDVAGFYGITTKEGKITSALIAKDNKFLVCTMGSNTIPKNTFLTIKEFMK